MVAETSPRLPGLRRDRKILVKDSGTLTLREAGHQIMGSPKGDPLARPDPRDSREGHWDGSRVRWRSSRVPEAAWAARRSEEHTSELQSRQYLVCRLLLE